MAEHLRFCDHADCQYFKRESVGTAVPTHCPTCAREADWQFEALPRSVAAELDDRRFLESIRITPEW